MQQYYLSYLTYQGKIHPALNNQAHTLWPTIIDSNITTALMSKINERKQTELYTIGRAASLVHIK